MTLQDEFQATQDAISSGAFDPQGSNYTTFGGTPYSSGDFWPSNIGSSYGSAASSANIGSTSSRTIGTPQGTNASTTRTPLQVGTIYPSGYTSDGVGGTVADYFARAVIIVLGFIFVAVGLMMFR